MAKEIINEAMLPSGAALAFLGDAVYSLHIRQRAVEAGLSKSGELHEAANFYVTARAQAAVLRKVRPFFTPIEENVYRRASNSTHIKKPHGATIADYRAATGLEAVLGLLCYLGDNDRLQYLLELTHKDIHD